MGISASYYRSSSERFVQGFVSQGGASAISTQPNIGESLESVSTIGDGGGDPRLAASSLPRCE